MQAVRHLLYKVGPMLFASSLNDPWWYNYMKMSQVAISLQIQLVVSTMEWLPLLQLDYSYSDVGYETFNTGIRDWLHKAWKAAAQFMLQPQHTTLRTSVRESPACITSMEIPCYNFEVHL